MTAGRYSAGKKKETGGQELLETRLSGFRRTEEELLVDSKLPPEFFSRYFRLDDNLPSIYESINRDLLIDRAISKYRGLRLIRQDPWECLISYMLATASSIPTIQKRIFLLSQFFGQELEAGYFSFPDPETLANADISMLDKCKLGFRTERIKEAAREVASARAGS